MSVGENVLINVENFSIYSYRKFCPIKICNKILMELLPSCEMKGRNILHCKHLKLPCALGQKQLFSNIFLNFFKFTFFSNFLFNQANLYENYHILNYKQSWKSSPVISQQRAKWDILPLLNTAFSHVTYNFTHWATKSQFPTQLSKFFLSHIFFFVLPGFPRRLKKKQTTSSFYFIKIKSLHMWLR